MVGTPLCTEGLLVDSRAELEQKLDSFQYLSLLLSTSSLGEDSLEQVAEVADIHGITPRVLVEDSIPLHDLASSLFILESEAEELVEHCKTVVGKVRLLLEEKEAFEIPARSEREAAAGAGLRESVEGLEAAEQFLRRSPEPPAFLVDHRSAPSFASAFGLGFENALEEEFAPYAPSERTTKFVFSGSVDVANNEGMGDSSEAMQEQATNQQSRKMYFGGDARSERVPHPENVATQETTCATDPSISSFLKTGSDASVSSQMSTNQRANARDSAGLWTGTSEATSSLFAGFQGSSAPVLPYEILQPAEGPVGSNSPQLNIPPVRTGVRSPSPEPRTSNYGFSHPPVGNDSPTGPEYMRSPSPAPRNINFGSNNGSSGWMDPPMVSFARFRSVEPRACNPRINTFRHASVPPRFQSVEGPSYLRPTAASEARRRATEESRELLRLRQTPPARSIPRQTQRRRSKGPSESLTRPTQSSLARQQATHLNVDGSLHGQNHAGRNHGNSSNEEDDFRSLGLNPTTLSFEGLSIEPPNSGHLGDPLSTLEE